METVIALGRTGHKIKFGYILTDLNNKHAKQNSRLALRKKWLGGVKVATRRYQVSAADAPKHLMVKKQTHFLNKSVI